MVDKPISVKEILNGINESISNNMVNSPFDSSDMRNINSLNYKIKIGESLTSNEIDVLESLALKIKNLSDKVNSYNINQNDVLSNLINSYKKIINDNNLSLESRKEAIIEFQRLLSSNSMVNDTKIPNIGSDVNKIIENAKDVKIKNGNLINPKSMDDKVVSSEKDSSNSFSSSEDKKPTFSDKLADKSSSTHQNIKSGLDLALGVVGLGGINKAFDSSSAIMSRVSKFIGRKKQSNIEVPDEPAEEVDDLKNPKSNIYNPSEDQSQNKELSNIVNQIRYSNKLLEKIFSELRISENNKKDKKKEDKEENKESSSLLDDIGLDLGGNGSNKSKSSKKKSLGKSGKVRKAGRLGRFGRALGKGAGKLAGSALYLAGAGDITEMAGGASSLLGKGVELTSSIGSKIGSGLSTVADATGLSGVAGKVGSGISSVAGKVGLGGALKAGSKLAKFIPGLGLAATAGSAAFSAYQGYNDKDAEKLFGSKSVSAKLGSSLASVGSDLSFGLISKESIASVEKSIGGGVTSAFNWLIGKKDKEETKEKVTKKEEKEKNSVFGDMKPEEIKSMFSGFGASISSFIEGVPNILKSLGSFLPELAKAAIPGLSGAVNAVKQVANSETGKAIGSALGAAVGAGNNGAWDILTGKSARYGGANDGTLGNTGKGKKLSQVADERTQILYNEAKKSGMSKEQITMMMGQVDHETGGFKFMRELAYGKKYEGRKDLGNTQAGDGERFKGRGFNQLTGRANYAWMSKELGIDLISHPELAEDPQISAKIAVIYHKKRVKNAKTVEEATKAVNGGYNHLGDRKEATQKWAGIMNSSDNKFEKNYADGSMDKSLKDQDQSKNSNKPIEASTNIDKQPQTTATVQQTQQPIVNVKQNLADQKQNELAQQSNMINQSIQRPQDNSNNQNGSVVLNPPKKDTIDIIDDLNLLAARNGLFS